MGGEGLVSATRFLVLALSVLYIVGSLSGLFLLDFDSTRDSLLWVGFLLGGATLMLVGQLVVPRGGRSALLVSLGAVLGGLPLFWTLLVPVAVAAVIACSIALPRRPAPA
jgi:hypothetical protein